MKILPITNFTNKNIVCKPRKYNTTTVCEPTPCDTVCFRGINKTTAPKIIILLGAPNSGKGTCARKIAE